MENQNFEKNDRTKHSLKSVILESKKIRENRGEDFFQNKKSINPEIENANSTSKIQVQTSKKESENDGEKNIKNVREAHLKLAGSIVAYEKKIFDQNDQVLTKKKTRSKSIHLYVDETIHHFLTSEVKKSEAKWGLRKNAGLGQLIQKFILNFIEIKKREEKQLKRVRKVIDDFRSNLVEFKKSSASAVEFQKAEEVNQKMKILSNDLNILLNLLEFEDEALKICLGDDQYTWVEFILRWKHQA